MPYINVSVSVPVSKTGAENFKSDMGKAIGVFPGKTEQWLMVCIEENSKMWFAGTNEQPTAYAEVSLFGRVDAAAAEKMTAKICESMQRNLGVPPERVYVKYESADLWGFNGTNF